MPKIKPYEIGSESKPSEEVITEAAAEDATVPVPEDTELLPVVQDTPLPLGTISGDISADDIIIPRLNLVQGVGSLSELFTPGQIVLNKETVLSDGATPLEITVLSARKQFIENLPFDSEEKPRVLDTLEDVYAAGGRIEWSGVTPPTFTPVLHVQIVFKAPQDSDYAYPLDYNGTSYGLAVWSLRGVAYTRAGRNILTAAKFALRDGLFNGKWELTTKREKFGRNSVVVPVLRNVGRHSQEFVEFLRHIG